ncbi:MAG: hypothetical protein JST54_27150 [Deltaproteobacteria bacterium]|nr:hypothetical protein [Deltaproteobacteria bacterium]
MTKPPTDTETTPPAAAVAKPVAASPGDRYAEERAFMEIVQRTNSRLENANTVDLEGNYLIGRDVVALERNPAAFGYKTVKDLAKRIGMRGSDKLYRRARVARHLSPEEFAEAKRLRSMGGFAITWTHFDEIAAVFARNGTDNDPAKTVAGLTFVEWVKLVVYNELSQRDLRKALRSTDCIAPNKQEGNRDAGASGSTPAQESDSTDTIFPPAARLMPSSTEIRRVTDTLVAAVNDSRRLVDAIEVVAPSTVSTADRASVSEVSDVIWSASSAISVLADRARRARNQMPIGPIVFKLPPVLPEPASAPPNSSDPVAQPVEPDGVDRLEPAYGATPPDIADTSSRSRFPAHLMPPWTRPPPDQPSSPNQSETASHGALAAPSAEPVLSLPEPRQLRPQTTTETGYTGPIPPWAQQPSAAPIGNADPSTSNKSTRWTGPVPPFAQRPIE